VWCLSRVEDPVQFDATLFQPPAGGRVSPDVIEGELADFAALAAAFGAG
jgi:hypothetical protein